MSTTRVTIEENSGYSGKYIFKMVELPYNTVRRLIARALAPEIKRVQDIKNKKLAARVAHNKRKKIMAR